MKNNIIGLFTLSIALLIGATSCTTHEDEPYTINSGERAFFCHERFVGESSSAISDIIALENFRKFVKDNTLDDKSNQLAVWKQAEAEVLGNRLYVDPKDGNEFYKVTKSGGAVAFYVKFSAEKPFEIGGKAYISYTRTDDTATLNSRCISYEGENRWLITLDKFYVEQIDQHEYMSHYAPYLAKVPSAEVSGTIAITPTDVSQSTNGLKILPQNVRFKIEDNATTCHTSGGNRIEMTVADGSDVYLGHNFKYLSGTYTLKIKDTTRALNEDAKIVVAAYDKSNRESVSVTYKTTTKKLYVI